jgi:hypothetical protein
MASRTSDAEWRGDVKSGEDQARQRRASDLRLRNWAPRLRGPLFRQAAISPPLPIQSAYAAPSCCEASGGAARARVHQKSILPFCCWS